MQTRSFATTVVGLAVGGLLGAALVHSDAAAWLLRRDEANARPATYSETTKAGTATPLDEAAAAVEGRLGAAGIDSIDVGVPPVDTKVSRGWLEIAGSVPTEADGRLTEFGWKADLATGAVIDLAHSDQASVREVVVGTSAIAHLPDGRSVDVSGGVGDIAAGQVFSVEVDAPTEAIERIVSESLAKFGLEADAVEVLRPLQTAVQVVVRVPDGELAWTVPDLVAQVQGDARFEGVLLTLRSPGGSVAATVSHSYRTGNHRTWLAPGVDAGRFGIGVAGGPLAP